MPPFHHPQ